MSNPINYMMGIIVLSSIAISCAKDDNDTATPNPEPSISVMQVDTFTFSSNGVAANGMIYIPEAYASNTNLPSIYLIDYQEQHFSVATDEFDQLIDATIALGIDALVLTLEEHLDIESSPGSFESHRDKFIDMAAYVSDNYTDNTSRTFVGRGSEGGVVLLTMLHEDPDSPVFEKYIATDSSTSFNSEVISTIQNEDVPEMPNKRLHFSYSSSNNQASCSALINSIVQTQYPWLSFDSETYSGMSFTEAYPTAFTDGLEFVFEE